LTHYHHRASTGNSQYLVEQLAVGGRLVVPIGSRDVQRLYKLTVPRESTGIRKEDLGGCRFVSLIGRADGKIKPELA